MRRRLGSGGFATVWLAYDEQLDAEVAVKVLADNWGHDDSVRRRFLEEGRFLRRVESEHVVQVHDVGELEDGRPFLVLTYADRGTLADRLRDAPLLLEPAVGVIVQVGRGLQALHRRGLLHRDVKPANVLFRSTDEGERAVLSDLGLGKSLDEISRITMPGGTPSYVAPEQAMGERLDQRADQYSLGAVAYAALTGRSPHQVDGLGAAGRVHAPAPPSSLGFDVPDRIDAAIVRALDPDRERRWPDVVTFTRELVGALDQTTHSFLASNLKIPASGAAGAAAAGATEPGASSTTDAGPAVGAGAAAGDGGGAAEGVGPDSPTEVVDPAGEKTALSDANAPTVVKTPEPGAASGTVAGSATGAGSGTGGSATGAGSGPEGAAGGPPIAAFTGGSPAAPTTMDNAGPADGGGASAATPSGSSATGSTSRPAVAGATGEVAGGAVVGAGSGEGAGAARGAGAQAGGAERAAGATGKVAGGAVEGAGSGDVVGGAAEGAGAKAAVRGGEQAAGGKKARRRGRWVVAALLAVVIGGGAGFGVQRYLEPRVMVDVHREPFSLKVPGAVAGVVAESSWRPPGSTKDWPAVRVSKDNNWSADVRTPGVFVGAMNYPSDPAKSLVGADRFGCTDSGLSESTDGAGRRMLDRYAFDCGDGTSLLQRLVETAEGTALLIQVRLEGNDAGRAAEIANSVEYAGGGAP